MRKFYFIMLSCCSIIASAQITPVKTNFGDPQGASLGDRVIFVNGATGEIGSTDGTVAGTVAIPTATVVLGGMNVGKLNNRIIFVGVNILTGMELWQSDGTIAGTILLRDIAAGTAGSDPQGGDEGFITVGNTCYFTADDGINGRELWKTDGTTLGTSMVKDINATAINFPFLLGSSPGNLLFFTASTAANGLELWKSDGTDAGTVMVKNITAGTSSTTFSKLFVGNGTHMFFIADNGIDGAELWRTDGTDAGTMMMANINPGGHGFNLSSGGGWDWSFHMFNNVLYFQPNGMGVTGTKIYRSNGTAPGTTLVTDLNPSSMDYIDLHNAADIGSRFYFPALGELYGTDGTAGGTTMVKDINPGVAGSNPRIMLPRENIGTGFLPGLFAGGRFFFYANNGVNGDELWVSDGTNAGTVLVKDIFPGASSSTSGNETYYYTKYRFFLSADDGVNGYELWQSDGTAAGTTLVSNINPGAASSDLEFFGVANASNKLVFRSNNGDGDDVNVLDAVVVPFPLQLTAFEAQLKNKDVMLQWTTQNEINFSHFNVQRSTSGVEFSPIATIKGTGGIANNYSYLDKDPGKAGIYYYRLEMADKNGQSVYSKIATVKIRSGFDVSISSNRNEVLISANDADDMATIRLVDMNGKTRLLRSQRLVTGTVVRIPLSHLSSGIYIIAVECKGELQTHRIVR